MKPLDTLRLLGTGGEAPEPAKQRVYGALMASLAAAAATTAAATTGPAGVAAVDSAPLPAGALVAAPAPLIAGLGSAKAVAVAAGIWLLGGATGAALYSALHPRDVRVVYVDRPVLSTPEGARPAEVALPASASSAPPAAAVGASAKRAAATPVNPASQLSRERALLDLARALAARGEPALSLQQAERHRAQFPHGKLAEEREAMAIRALHSLGRSREARARAQAFRLAYPNSFLTPAIESALSGP